MGTQHETGEQDFLVLPFYVVVNTSRNWTRAGPSRVVSLIQFQCVWLLGYVVFEWWSIHHVYKIYLEWFVSPHMCQYFSVRLLQACLVVRLPSSHGHSARNWRARFCFHCIIFKISTYLKASGNNINRSISSFSSAAVVKSWALSTKLASEKLFWDRSCLQESDCVAAVTLRITHC